MSTRADAAAWTLERLADAQWAGVAPHAPLEPPSPPPPPPAAEPEEGVCPRGARPVNFSHSAPLVNFCTRLERHARPALEFAFAEPLGACGSCLGALPGCTRC